MIVNDAQIRRIVVEEFYDKENPRFELELFAESRYSLSYTTIKNDIEKDKLLYSSLKKSVKAPTNKKEEKSKSLNSICSICNKTIDINTCIKADGGKTLICKPCFSKLF